MEITLNQNVELPQTPLPIAIIGSGGIIRDAHIPAYSKVNFPILGIYDLNEEKAIALKEEFPIIQQTFSTLEDLIKAATKARAVFDVAVPAQHIVKILQKIPEGSCVLIQKPMGETLEEAKAILNICREKNLVSGINFQLRYAPYMTAARDLINQGLLGRLSKI